MKNILKYSAAAAMSVLALASCEEMENYQTTIDAAPKLTYVNLKGGDTFSTRITHRPIGSQGSFHTEFQPNCNTTSHGDVTVTVELDPGLVAEYNQKHGTNYVALPGEYIKITNPSVRIAADTTAARDTVKIDLDEGQDLSKLTERAYLAPFSLTSDGLQTSEQKGYLWFIVSTETNIIRPISSENDLVGFTAGGSTDWTADCGNFANLFDGNTSSYVTFEAGNSVIVDMKKELMVTGLKLNTSSMSATSIEYSIDGLQWSQAGTPVEGEYSYSDRVWCAAVYDYFSARYLRLTFESYSRVNELEIYMIESTEPTLYTQTGVDNTVSGKIVHVKGVGSSSDFSSAFKVYTTISSDKGYNVNVSVDNSLIAAYNEKHKTSYAQMPSENIDLQNASMEIAAGDNATPDEVKLALKGDLTGLTDENGYLIPLTMKASGAVTSESRGTVYAVIVPETKLIKSIKSADEITGFLAGGKNSWSADCDDSASLFDGDNGTSVYFNGSDNVLTVNLGGKHLVTGLDLYTYRLKNISIEFSLDGTSWKSAGTADEGDVVFSGGSSNYRQGDYYVAFGEYLEASYLRLSFDFNMNYSYYNRIGEINVYEIESTEPTIYTICGADNTFTGEIVHHITAGSKGSLSAEFNVMTTISSAGGWSVKAEGEASLVSSYNSKNGTKYAPLDPSYIAITGSPCQIGAGATRSEGKISLALTGDVSKLTNADGYLLPIRLSASGAVTSTNRGIVYVVITTRKSAEAIRSISSASDIEGTEVADRTGWKIIACDEGGIYTADSKPYSSLFDGSRDTYVRTWGGPITFTVDLGKEYDMTGFVITARSGNYERYQPNSVYIEGSTDGSEYVELGTASTSAGTLLNASPSSYGAFYGVKVRYLKINADYGGSNMGTAEFNIYAK